MISGGLFPKIFRAFGAIVLILLTRMQKINPIPFVLIKQEIILSSINPYSAGKFEKGRAKV